MSRDVWLWREKVIISSDSEVGGPEELVVLDLIAEHRPDWGVPDA